MPKRVIACPDCNGAGKCKRCNGIGMVTVGKNYGSDWRKPTASERKELRTAILESKRK